MTIPDHEYVGDWAEKERVERFIAWFRNDVDALWGGGIPDWQYEYEGEDWYIEITSASTRPREHGAAYRRRLADDPTSATVPSSSGLTDRGIPFETTEANESELRRAIAEAVRRKGPNIKRYGHPSRTHLLIDASGDTVADEAASTDWLPLSLCPTTTHTPESSSCLLSAVGSASSCSFDFGEG